MKICFVGTYKPIMCGLADYTASIVEQSPVGETGVISFNPDTYGDPVTGILKKRQESIWRGIESRDNFSAASILKGLTCLPEKDKKTVLWFQHEFGIWRDSQKFIAMLKELKTKKIITFHTIHFQSKETRTGLTKKEYELLGKILDDVDAITIFSQGAYNAIVKTWPGHQEKIHLLEHGVHFCPETAGMSKKDARSRLFKFLIEKSNLSKEKKQEIEKQNLFFDSNTIMVGSSGFIAPKKSSGLIFDARDQLQKLIPNKRIIAVHIGALRAVWKEEDVCYYQQFKKKHNGLNKFLLDIWLPLEILPLAQKSFDLVFYWPKICTQSGILTHALGVGAPIVGRDMEGVGEVLKQAGQIAEKNWSKLIEKARRVLLDSAFAQKMSEQGLNYAQKYRYQNQAQKHLQLARHILRAF